MIEGRFNGDPFCAKVCASCGQEDEATVVEGIGPDSVRCANCGAPAAPFAFTNGYTIAFDDEWRVGVTVGRGRAEEFANDAQAVGAIPEHSVQNPILLFAPHDLVGVATRLRPFMGQIGTIPAVDLGAPPPRGHAGGARGPHRRAPRHRLGPGRGDPDRAGQGGRSRDLPRRHARHAG
jgi:acetamidase/formamidase